MNHYAGASWIQGQIEHGRYKGPLSPIGRKAATILGDLYQGIYHIEDQAQKVNWSNPDFITIVVYKSHGLATFDGDQLTQLVLMAHLLSVRVSIEPASPRHLRLVFAHRTREGDLYFRHPGLSEAIEMFNAHYGVDVLKDDLADEQ